MSGCVTVSGPPRASWRWNSGTTEPVLPSTLPNRTVMQRMPWPVVREASRGCARASISSAWQYISASRLDAPITEARLDDLEPAGRHHGERDEALNDPQCQIHDRVPREASGEGLSA